MDDLLLISGIDIPFEEGHITIHHPKIKEIAYVGEETVFSGLETLNFSKNNLLEEDKKSLEQYSDFEVLMSIVEEQNITSKKLKATLTLLLSLLFPQHSISFKQKEILLVNENNKDDNGIINKDNFENFRKIINKMIPLKNNKEELNPDGDIAKRIADKIKKRHQKLADAKGENANNKVDIISRYISILSVGEQKDMNCFMNYTIYQLFDEFKRYELKTAFDFNIQAKMAGAKDLKDAEDWMQDIHE